MNVNVFGFNWQVDGGLFLQDFLTYISGKGQVTHEDYILSVVNRDGYWVGLVLRIKDQQSFAKIVNESNGTFTITEQQLGRNERPVDFNFFLVNSATGRGLYQQYYQSTGLATLTKIMNLEFRQYKEIRVLEDARKKIGTAAQLNKRYRGRIKFKYWENPQAFSALLAKLKQIKAVEIDVETDDLSEPKFRSIKEVSDKETRRFSFGQGAALAALRNKIVSLVNDADGDANIKVRGIDAADMPITLYVEENLEKLSVSDYDEMVGGLTIRSDQLDATISQSNVATHLIGVAQSPKVRAMLGKPQDYRRGR